MKILLSYRLFVSGFFLIIIVNIIVLSQVAYNHSGEPESLVKLTQREVQLPYYHHNENSGLSANIIWRTLGKDTQASYYRYHWDSPIWFDEEKLKSIGFKTTLYADKSFKKEKEPLPKEVFIVFEYNGPAYKEAVTRAENLLKEAKQAYDKDPENKELKDKLTQAKERVDKELNEMSRLFAVDVGLDPVKLRQLYNQKSKFIITPGIVNVRYDYIDKNKKLLGYISSLSVSNIHIPLKFKKIFGEIINTKKKESKQKTNYNIEIAYGKRLEPWIMSVRQN